MIKRLATVLALIGLTACVKHDYSGERYEQNDPNDVRVYTDASRVPSGMRVIGTDRATGEGSVDSEQIVNDMIRKAASVGADAVLIEKTETVAAKRQVEGSETAGSTAGGGAEARSTVVTARFYRGGSR